FGPGERQVSCQLSTKNRPVECPCSFHRSQERRVLMNTFTGCGYGGPRVRLEADSVYEVVELLDRFVHWLDGPSFSATEDCTVAMSMGQSTDPESISDWAAELAEHFRYRADTSQHARDAMVALR